MWSCWFLPHISPSEFEDELTFIILYFTYTIKVNHFSFCLFVTYWVEFLRKRNKTSSYTEHAAQKSHNNKSSVFWFVFSTMKIHFLSHTHEFCLLIQQTWFMNASRCLSSTTWTSSLFILSPLFLTLSPPASLPHASGWSLGLMAPSRREDWGCRRERTEC